jgi:subtilisin family serine protease
VVKENFIDGNPYAPETHGTGVAGIIAAHADNGVGIEGVAPGARLMALRACWQRPDQATRCDSFTLGKALNFAIMHGAQVINLSLSGPPDRLLQQLLDVALARGIKVVGAVDPQRADGGFPASCPGVLAVTDDEARSAAAGILVAPGRDIPTTTVGAKWHFVSGSSYAAAHVSGMVAMLSELRPALRPSEVRAEIVANSAGSLDARTAGTINPCATIARATAKCACFCPSTQASKAAHYP